MTTPAIRLLGTKIHLHCHIKPSASKIREGITSITGDFINICVSAPPRNGESNKAVREVLSRVLGVPKTDVEIVKGGKSKEKVVAVGGFGFVGEEGDVEARIKEVRRRLEGSVT